MSSLTLKVVNTLPEQLDHKTLYFVKNLDNLTIDIVYTSLDGSDVRKNLTPDDVRSLVQPTVATKEDAEHLHLIEEIDGLVDTLTSLQSTGDYLTLDAANAVQEALVDQLNIKTLNLNSLLSSGNLSIVFDGEHAYKTNLDADVHSHYFTTLRGDERYVQKEHTHEMHDLIGGSNYPTIEDADLLYAKQNETESTTNTVIEGFVVEGQGVNFTRVDGVVTVSAEIENLTTETLASLVTREALENHEHDISDVANLQTALDNKLPLGDYLERTDYTTSLAIKQTKLQNGVNIKTIAGNGVANEGDIPLVSINGSSIVGSGNLNLGLDYLVPTSVNTRTGDIVLSQSDVDLSNVFNSPDIDKPISTLLASELETKVNLSGDTLSGSLILSGNVVNEEQALPKQQLDSIIQTTTSAINDNSFFVTKSGDAFEGPLQLNADATDSLEAITKQQMDVLQEDNLNRLYHTGIQLISSVTNLQFILDAKQPVLKNEVNIKPVYTISLLGEGDVTFTHADLDNKEDDDHPQYFNQERGDDRYVQKEVLKQTLGEYLIEGSPLTLVDNGTTITINSEELVAQTTSIHGNQGDCVLTSTDIGAQAIGHTPGEILSHKNKENPHPQYLRLNNFIESDNVNLYQDDVTNTIMVEAAVEASVNSVNGKIGDLTITATDVGAAPTGEAESAITSHRTSDKHQNYFTQSYADILYTKLVHSHQPTDITNLDNYIEDTAYASLTTDANLTLAFNDHIRKLMISAPNYKVNNITNDYTVKIYRNLKARDVVRFKYPIENAKFNSKIFALKESGGIGGLTYTLEDFSDNVSFKYDYTDSIYWDDGVKLFSGGIYSFVDEVGEYTIDIDLTHRSFKTDTSDHIKSVLPELDPLDPDTDYVVTSSNGVNPIHAFDGDNNTYWSVESPNVSGTQWLQVEFPASIIVKSYTMIFNQSVYGYWEGNGCLPRDWALQASSDGLVWDTLDNVTDYRVNINGSATLSRTVVNNKTYKYYRFSFTESNNEVELRIGSILLMGTHPFNLKDNEGTYYTVNEGVLTAIATPFSEGFAEAEVNEDQYNTMTSLKLVSSDSGEVTINYAPHPQILIQKRVVDIRSFGKLYNFSIDHTKETDTDLKIAVSHPVTGEWLVYRAGQWVSMGYLEATLEDAVKLNNQGMVIDEIKSLTIDDWAKLFDSFHNNQPTDIRLAYAFNSSDPSGTPVKLSKTQFKYDSKTHWVVTNTDVDLIVDRQFVEFRVLNYGTYAFAYQKPIFNEDLLLAEVGSDTSTLLDLESGYVLTA